MKKQVLFYAGDRPERARQLKQIVRTRDDIEFRAVTPEDTDQLVGYLLGESGYPKLESPKLESPKFESPKFGGQKWTQKKAAPFSAGKRAAIPTELPSKNEVLLLNGFTEDELTDFLYFLRCRFFLVEIKAMATEQNRRWTFRQLIVQLVREHSLQREGS